jgi:hypothetical protein
MNTRNLNNEAFFEKHIDYWVENQIKNEIYDFNSLILSLPSVYPKLVIDSLNRLLSKKRINKKLYNKLIKESKQKMPQSIEKEIRNILFPPHPLDFDWRFTQKTSDELISISIKLTGPEDTIVFLGTPSLFNQVIKQNINRNFLLIDTNSSDFININKNCSIKIFNLFEGVHHIYHNCAKLIIIDPPWYPEYQRAFLNNASKICQYNGMILLVTPKAGTRPTIRREWQSLLVWANKIGLKNEGLLNINVAYDTPYFEKNALKKSGILNFPLDWRSADLTIFKKQSEQCVHFSKKRYRSDWYNESYMGIRIRRRPERKGFRDPSLKTIIPGNILPSVSRRDERRKTADVWTYGNRIFKCEGTTFLHNILCSLNDGYSPTKQIEFSLRRKLTFPENKLVKKTINQIKKLTELEKNEIFGGIK